MEDGVKEVVAKEGEGDVCFVYGARKGRVKGATASAEGCPRAVLSRDG